HVVDVDVRLALAAVAENVEVRRIGKQLAHEVEADAVGLSRSDDVAEPERAAGEVEHRGVRRDQRLASELARAVRQDRDERTGVLLGFGLAEVAVDTTP